MELEGGESVTKVLVVDEGGAQKFAGYEMVSLKLYQCSPLHVCKHYLKKE